jgi:TonB family protein
MIRKLASLSLPFVGGVVVALGPGACAEAEPLPETPPRQLSESTFNYPVDLWDRNIQGQTTLRIYVSPVGQVDSALVQHSSGYPGFDSAAVDGAHKLRFDPARRGDAPVGAWVLLPVQFIKANAAPNQQDTP